VGNQIFTALIHCRNLL